MTFKEVNPGFTVYVLDKKEFKVIHGKVTAKTPRVEIDNKTYQSKAVVDVAIDLNGTNFTFTIPETQSITYSNDYILSTDEAALAAEIKYMLNQSQQFIESVPRHKTVIEKAPGLLAQIDPAYKERVETEKRFSTIETDVKGMKDTVCELKEMMKSFIDEFKK